VVWWRARRNGYHDVCSHLGQSCEQMKASAASLRPAGTPRTRSRAASRLGAGEPSGRERQESVEIEDRKLIIQVSRGDSRALAALYDRYAPASFGLAVKVCGNRALAEDVVQEAFLSIWRRGDADGGASNGRREGTDGRSALYDPERGSVASYILGAVRNKAVDAVRHEESVHRREQAFSDQPGAGTGQEPEEAAWLVFRRDQVRRAVTRLPGPQREAIELAYFGGLTYREVASELGIPLGTAKTRLRDGMSRLRNLLSSPPSEGVP
jgi:RNA polymerase sigma-70 factor (ECF subfamily)